MKILLDTHLLIWIHTNTSKLPQTFLSYTQDPENEFFYSSASIWETQIKYTKNKALFLFLEVFWINIVCNLE